MPARLSIALIAVAALVALGAPAAAPAASEPYYGVPGAVGAGPAKYNRVFVHQFGPANATRVLILVPGYAGGSGDFTLMARELVKRVPRLQVWALDRRTQPFEDTSVFARNPTLQQAFDYYLGFKFKQVNGKADAPFARRWGLKLALEDLRRVVLRARAGGRRKVILGGHSLGASTTAAYATWDFSGRRGYEDIEGMVLIDGGLLGSFSTPSLAAVRARLRDLATADPFVDLLGAGVPWAAGIFAEIGALYARREPAAPSPLQSFPLLPASFKPAFPVTNEALLGNAFDKTTSPRGLELLRLRAGGLAPTGNPRPWRNGEVTPIQNVARTFFQEPGNAVEWYFPKKLTLDVDGANALTRNPITNFLGLRTWHLAQVDVPLYAYQTDLTNGRVLRGARAFVGRSNVPRSLLVDDSRITSHLDPLTAAPNRTRFYTTLVPFLKALR